jgi:hypothetical protein
VRKHLKSEQKPTEFETEAMLNINDKNWYLLEKPEASQLKKKSYQAKAKFDIGKLSYLK